MQREQAATAVAEPTSRYANINGLKLHYFDWGGDASKHTLLLLHGGSAHAHWWDAVGPQLVPCGRVIALDFRGHGRSQWADVYGPAANIGDLRVLIREHLRSRVVMIGHSMGGEHAQRIAVESPELLEALVIVDANHGGLPLKTRLLWRWKRRNQGGERREFASGQELVRRFRLSPPGHNMSREAFESLALKGAEQLPNANWAFRFDPRTRVLKGGWRGYRKPRLQRIQIPVLILRGEHSGLVSPREARRMHRRIRGSTLKDIPRSYHHVSLDNPDDTAAAIIEFVDAL